MCRSRSTVRVSSPEDTSAAAAPSPLNAAALLPVRWERREVGGDRGRELRGLRESRPGAAAGEAALPPLPLPLALRGWRKAEEAAAAAAKMSAMVALVSAGCTGVASPAAARGGRRGGSAALLGRDAIVLGAPAATSTAEDGKARPALLLLLLLLLATLLLADAAAVDLDDVPRPPTAGFLNICRVSWGASAPLLLLALDEGVALGSALLPE